MKSRMSGFLWMVLAAVVLVALYLYLAAGMGRSLP